VPRSCDRAERDWAAPSACRLGRVLHAIANASRARQGHAIRESPSEHFAFCSQDRKAHVWRVDITMEPCSMFMPQANAISPVFAGVSSMTTGSFEREPSLDIGDGTTTSVPQVLSVDKR